MLVRLLFGRVTTVACVLGLSATVSVGQSVKGRIIDRSDGTGIPGANVYISGTTLGAATAADGSFVIEDVERGRLDLVVSVIGYESAARTISLSGDAVEVGLISLTPTIYSSGNVVVTSKRPKNWRRNLERFTKEFLGTSPNAEKCRIVDPYVLDFTEDPVTNSLKASAKHPLVVENRALGYRVTFVLQDFQVASWEYRIRFRGQPRYEPLEPTSEAERQEWEVAREKAYSGSFQHFLYALARGRAHREGFELRLGDETITDPNSIRFLPVAVEDSLVVSGRVSYERLLYSKQPLHVTYTRAEESARYARFVTEVTGVPQRPHGGQHSVLTFERAVTMHTSGYIYDPYLVKTTGYWIWARVADMLPRNYAPGESGAP